MSEEKKVSAEELDAVAGGIGGDVNIGDTGNDATIIDESVNQKIDNSVRVDKSTHDSHNIDQSKRDSHNVDVDTKTSVSYTKKGGLF